MFNSFENIQGWIFMLVLVLFVAIIAFTGYSIYKIGASESKKERWIWFKKSIISSSLLFVYLFFFFLNFGNDIPVEKEVVEDSERYMLMQESGDEMTSEEIDEDYEESKSISLRIQSDESLRQEVLIKGQQRADSIYEKYANK